jgi:hypothetical protein
MDVLNAFRDAFITLMTFLRVRLDAGAADVECVIKGVITIPRSFDRVRQQVAKASFKVFRNNRSLELTNNAHQIIQFAKTPCIDETTK